jgi:hypothetical protein
LLNILVNIGRSFENLCGRLSLKKHIPMKYLLGLVLGFLISSAAFAQKEIKLEEVDKHVGDSVTLTGKVYGGRYFPHGEGASTLLNLGAAYPNQLLTVVMRGTARKEFPGVPERDLLDQEVRVSGKVDLYKGKPQIVLYTTSQLAVVEKAKPTPGQ